MILICQDANILTPPLTKALKVDKLLRTFNDHVQVDFFFIQEIGGYPVLHARDKATGYSKTTLLPAKDMDFASDAFRRMRIDSHGPPGIVSADP